LLVVVLLLHSPAGSGCADVSLVCGRFGLSEIINHLLSTANDGDDDDDEHAASAAPVKRRPFDFLLDGEFIRTSLKMHMATRKLSAESAHQIEYVEAMPAPAPLSDFEHEDWVSSVHAAAGGVFLTASYDRHVRIWSATDKALLVDVPNAHEGIVKCVRWIDWTPAAAATATDNDDNDDGDDGDDESKAPVAPPLSGTFASSGDDHCVKVWACAPQQGTYQALYQFEGHEGAVDRICVEPGKSKLCSASWDGDLRIWDLALAASAAAEMRGDADAAAGKRRRTGADEDASDEVSGTSMNTCVAVLDGHAGRVAAAVWPTFDRIYSGGWDNSLRVWDVELSKCITTLTGPVPVHDVSYSMPTGLVATAHADRAVRIWDPRTTTTIIQKTLTSHKQWVSAVLWHPYSSSLLLSASYDNTVKMWDIRSSIPLFTIAAHADKALCIDWCGAEVFVSGGADRKLFVHGSQSGDSDATQTQQQKQAELDAAKKATGKR
jgi:ribosome biogenesis protein YTM1